MLAHDGALDWERNVLLSLFGLVFHGPACYAAYAYLDEAVKGRSVGVTFAKVGMHMVCRPILMSFMFVYSGWLSGFSPGMVADMWTRSAQEMKGMLFFSLLDMVLFQFVHPRLRVAVLNVVQVIFLRAFFD